MKNPYDLKIGTVYTLDTNGFYIVINIEKASSGAFIYYLTYKSTDGKHISNHIWHQYGDYTNLSKLIEAKKILQVLYGSDKGSL